MTKETMTDADKKAAEALLGRVYNADVDQATDIIARAIAAARAEGDAARPAWRWGCRVSAFAAMWWRIGTVAGWNSYAIPAGPQQALAVMADEYRMLLRAQGKLSYT